MRKLPFAISKRSIQSFLKFYYNERRKRESSLTKGQIGYLKGRYQNTSVILIGGLGGFHFGPDLEHTLNEIVGGEIWSIGKGSKAKIWTDEKGLLRSGSGEYRLNVWPKEVAVVIRRLLQILEYSETVRNSDRIIIMGHSSGGLINYTLGLLRKKKAKRFLADHGKDFPGVLRFSLKNLNSLARVLEKSSLVAINTPFRGICKRLRSLGSMIFDPKIIDCMNEDFLDYLKEESGIHPIDVLDLATHSEMTPKNIYKFHHFSSNTLGSFLRILSRIQGRGPNDGFVPKESAYLKKDDPHPVRDLNLGHRDHRDVIEHPEVGYAILKQLLKI